MHNWHLLLLLILTVLEPIISESCSIDGGQSSSRSLTEDRLWTQYGGYRFNKSPKDPGLNDQSEIRRINHRLQRTSFIGDRRREHHTLTPDEQRRSNSGRIYESVGDGDRKSRLLTGRYQYYKNDILQNDLSMEKPLYLSRNSEHKNEITHENVYGQNINMDINEKQNNNMTQIKDRHIIRSKENSFQSPQRDVHNKKDVMTKNNNRIVIYVHRDTNNDNDVFSRQNINKNGIFVERHSPNERSNRIRYSRNNIHEEVLAKGVKYQTNTKRNVRYSARENMLSVERKLRQDLKTINRRVTNEIVREYEERNTHNRNNPTDATNYEKYSRDNIRDTTSFPEHDIRQVNVRRILNNEMARSREVRNVHERNDMRVRIFSLDRSIRQRNTATITDSERTRDREERNTNDDSDVRNNQRRSRDTSRLIKSALQRDVRQENARRIKDSEMIRNRENRNVYERHEPSDISNYGKYSRQNIRESTSSLDRDIPRESTRTTGFERNPSHEKRNIYERRLMNIRDYERYSNKEDARSRTSSPERDIRQENAIRFTDNAMPPSHTEQSTFERKDRTDARNYRRYSRDNTHYMTLLLQRDIRQVNARRVTDLEMNSRREERNVFERDYRTDVRSYEKYSRHNIRDSTSSLDRDSRREITRVEAFKWAPSHEARNRNERNRLTDVRDYEMYLKDTTRSKTSSIKRIGRQENSISRSDTEQKVHERNDHINIKNYEKYSRHDTRDRTLSLDRGTRQGTTEVIKYDERTHNREKRNMNKRNDDTDISNYGRFSGEYNHDRTSSIKHDLFKGKTSNNDNERTHSRAKLNSNGRNEPTGIRNYQRYSRDSTRHMTSLLQQDTRQENARITDFNMVYSGKERNTNVKDMRTDIRKYQEYLGLNVRTFSLDRGMRRENSRITYDERAGNREERNINKRNKREIRDERYSRENTRAITSSLHRGIRQQDPIRNIDNAMSRSREARNIRENKPTDIRNYQKQSSDNTRDRTLLLERGVRHGNTRLSRNKDINRELSRRTKLTNAVRSRTVKELVAMTEISMNETSIFWQYLIYALQGVYIIGVFMQENAKISSMEWLTCSRLLKVD